MAEIANDMVSGACCSQCGVYFAKAHGYPVLCAACWADAPTADRAAMGVQLAREPEL